MIPGYKPFFENQSTATPATLLPSEGCNDTNTEKICGNGSNGSRGSSHPHAETIIERAAIQEYDGDLLRDQVNMEASAAYDRNRQSYEQANPGRDPRNVEALYRAYIARWQPDRKGDLPATPPNTRGNAELWRAWWKKVEGQNHG